MEQMNCCMGALQAAAVFTTANSSGLVQLQLLMHYNNCEPGVASVCSHRSMRRSRTCEFEGSLVDNLTITVTGIFAFSD